MGWQQSASRIKAINPDGGSDLVLPVDSIKIYAEEYVADGGTIQELVTGELKFVAPTFRFVMELSYDFERTDFRPTVYDTLDDLIDLYLTGSNAQSDGIDFHVKYDEDIDSYDISGGDYICSGMFPDIQGGSLATEFSNRARQKSRELTLRGKSKSNTYGDVRWILE